MSVTARGGYQIVDFKNTVLIAEADPVEIKGISEQLNNLYNKPVVLCNIMIQSDALAEPFRLQDGIQGYITREIDSDHGGYFYEIDLSSTLTRQQYAYIYINGIDQVSYTKEN